MIFEIVLSLVIVAYLGMGWEGRISSKLFISALFSIAGIIILVRRSWIKFEINKECFLHSIKIGVPMIPHNLSGVLNASVDRLFITHMIGLYDAGLYSVGYQIGGIIGLVATSFNNAYLPWIFKKLSTNDDAMKSAIVMFTYAYFFAIIMFAVTLSVLAPFLMSAWLGKEFHGSTIFVIWIAVGCAFGGMRYMVVTFLCFAEKTYLISAATLIGALCNLPLNFILIKFNGAIGAAQSTTIINVFIFFITWFFAAKHYPMPWLLRLRKKSIREERK